MFLNDNPLLTLFSFQKFQFGHCHIDRQVLPSLIWRSAYVFITVSLCNVPLNVLYQMLLIYKSYKIFTIFLKYLLQHSRMFTDLGLLSFGLYASQYSYDHCEITHWHGTPCASYPVSVRVCMCFILMWSVCISVYVCVFVCGLCFVTRCFQFLHLLFRACVVTLFKSVFVVCLYLFPVIVIVSPVPFETITFTLSYLLSIMCTQMFFKHFEFYIKNNLEKSVKIIKILLANFQKANRFHAWLYHFT